MTIRRSERRRTWLLPTAAAAVVAGVAVVVVVIADRAPSHPRAAATQQLRQELSSHGWHLDTLQRSGRSETSVPGSLRATLTFDKSGKFQASDGINQIWGTYQLTKKLQFREIGTTLVGYAGHDSRVLAVIKAMNAVLGEKCSRVSACIVQARADKSRLTLSTSAYTLEFSAAASPTQPTPERSMPATPIIASVGG